MVLNMTRCCHVLIRIIHAGDHMKMDRLIGILSLMLQKDTITVPELADLFEVSTRTIFRDIDTLSMAGIPIVTKQGNGGGIRIMDGYRVDRTVLTGDDMQAILAGLRSLDSVSGTNRYMQLMEKLSAGSGNVLAADHHFLINLASWDKSAVSDKITQIHEDICSKQTLLFHYSSPSGESSRSIEPYSLVFEWSQWYVWGWCMLRQDFRLFRLSRMTDLRSGEPFPGRPCPSPNLMTERVFPHRYQVKAVVQPEYRFRLLDDYGKDSFTEQADGTLLFSFGFTDEESILSWILSFKDGIELLEPEALRSKLWQFGRHLSGKYAET